MPKDKARANKCIIPKVAFRHQLQPQNQTNTTNLAGTAQDSAPTCRHLPRATHVLGNGDLLVNAEPFCGRAQTNVGNYNSNIMKDDDGKFGVFFTTPRLLELVMKGKAKKSRVV